MQGFYNKHWDVLRIFTVSWNIMFWSQPYLPETFRMLAKAFQHIGTHRACPAALWWGILRKHMIWNRCFLMWNLSKS